MPNLEGMRIALLGGDEREVILGEALCRGGASVVAAGYPREAIPEATHAHSVVDAVAEADVVIAPMSNTDERGRIVRCLDPDAALVLDEQAFEAMKPKAPLFIGVAKPVVRSLARRYETPLVEMAEIEEVAILNSIPTAEGAIQRAMEELPCTLHGTRAIVLGLGRCGLTLTRMLHGIGAKVTVAARSAASLARACEIGVDAVGLDDLQRAVKGAGVVFNTIPALVLTRPVLEALPGSAVVIDLASAPGGTDFAAARQLGVRAFLELGLPGRVAPKTAGEALAKTIPDLIEAWRDRSVVF